MEKTVKLPVSIPTLLKQSLVHCPEFRGAVLNGFIEGGDTDLGEFTAQSVLERYLQSEGSNWYVPRHPLAMRNNVPT